MPRRQDLQLNSLWISRKHAGLRQKSVARLLGHKSTSVISEYETGKLLPSLATALKLAVVYNRPVADLYPGLNGQVREEVEAARTKNRLGSNRALQSAPHI
jgi:DNA-binding XRE family transcriptional regulator